METVDEPGVLCSLMMKKDATARSSRTFWRRSFTARPTRSQEGIRVNCNGLKFFRVVSESLWRRGFDGLFASLQRCFPPPSILAALVVSSKVVSFPSHSLHKAYRAQ